ncbi:MAG: Ig-like domain-containing protein [Chloroflexota bacterium]
MVRASRAIGGVFRVLGVLSLILSAVPFFVPAAEADVGEQSLFLLTKTAQPSLVFTASTLSYTLTFENDGDVPSETIVVTDTLPAGATFISASEYGAFDGTIVTWNLPYTLGVDESSSVTFTVRAPNVAGSVINASYGITSPNAVAWTMGEVLETPVLPALVINEIMQNPAAVDDSVGEWLELYNPTAADVDINGWTIWDNGSDSHLIGNGGPLIIPAGGYLVLARNGDAAINGGVKVDYVYTSFTLANSDDEVVLLDGDLNEIDRVEYSGSLPWPDPTGASMALKDPALDNNVGENWVEETTAHYGDGDFGTPGWQNGTVLPDTDPPYVSSTQPTSGATNVDLGVTIQATFNENMDETTVTAGVFSLNPPVGGILSYDDTTNTLTFDPDADLNPNTTYAATIAGSLTDQAGNPMGADYTWSFTTGEGAPPPAIVINEVDADTPGTDELEFVELYDGGVGNTSLDGLVVVFYNGNGDTSYAAFDLDGFSTDADGYLVLGNSGVAPDITFNGNTLQNGADAVALYVGDAAGFPNGTAVTTANLIDAIVYGTDDPDDAGLLVLLNAGQPQVDENGGGDSAQHSNQRCPNGSGGARNTATYTQDIPTAGAANNCQALQIVATVPVDGATGVEVGVNVSATFNEAIDDATLSFTLAGPGGNVPGALSYDAASFTATFDPAVDLDGETTYTAQIAGSLTDQAGNPMGNDYAWSFTTAQVAPPDTEPPTIVSRSPEDGETDVDTTVAVSATFNEAIDSNTLGFTLTGPGGDVPGSLSYDAGSFTATFDPTAPLEYETGYTARIAAGLQDLSGNATAEAFVWSFTTGAPPPPALLLISEVQSRGAADAYDEFIELYNPSPDTAFNLNGYRISYQASSGDIGSRYTWEVDAFVPPYGHYLLINSRAYDGSVPGDATYTTGLADDAAIAIVRLSDRAIIDSLGWGSLDPATVTFVETSPAPGPGAEQSVERRPGGDDGNGQDTQDNSADFAVLDPPNPQNTASPPTPAIGPQIMTIAEARGLPDGSAVLVEGIATAPSGIYYAGGGNTKFYIQDGSGGAQIQLFGGNGPLPTVTLGDRVLVQGETGHYRGEFQIVPQDNVAGITLTDGAPEDAPLPLETAIADVGEGTEGWLITLEGLVIDAWDSGYGANVRLSDGQGHETYLYVDDLTGIDTTGIVVGMVQRFVGISSQYDERYETKPRIQSDVPAWPDQQGLCPAPAETAAGPLLIGAVHYDTLYPGFDELAEAVQLINTGDTPISLAGFYLSDNEASVALPDLWLDAGQKLWLARDADRFALEFGLAPAWSYGDLAPNLVFDNRGDEAVLLDGSGAVVDALVIEAGCAVEQTGWNDAHGVFPYFFGSYVASDGQILFRKLDETTARPLLDTDTAADWAQDPFNGGLGGSLLYPGWDLDAFFFPAQTEEQATTTLLVAPDNLYSGMAALFDEAQSTIDIEIYRFAHPALADRLVAAMDRGVQVRLLLEGEAYLAPDGTWDDVRWVAKQVYDHPNGQVYFWRDGADDDGVRLADRYNNVHQKFIVVDGLKAAILSENLSQNGLPHDDLSDGTAGNRGAAIVTTAPGVVAHLQAVFAADFDPAHHRDIDPFTPGRDDVRHEAGYEGQPLVRPDEWGNRAGYTPVRPEPLVLTGVTSFEVVQSPETSLRTGDALLGMVARAGAGDRVLVQQQYEHQYWGPYDAPFLNPRLNAYIEAARRGAAVRIMVANDDDNSYEDELIQYLNDLAAAEGLDLMAGKGSPTAGTLDGEPFGGHIHNKMVLVYDVATQGWTHVGSINGSENASKYNREMALQIGSDAAFNYFAGVFHTDWTASGLPGFLAAPAAAFEASSLTPSVGETVQFTNHSGGSAPIFYEWDFGDGSLPTTEKHPSHVYAAPGSYVVTLRAINAVGESSASLELQVGYPPSAAFTASPTTLLPGETVRFDNNSSGTEPQSYFWQFGDGATSEEENPTHVYANAGFYTVWLTVRNLWGEDTASGSISVYQPLEQFTINHMVIRWQRTDGRADFTFNGRLTLPTGYEPDDLTREAILSIQIGGKTLWQKVQLTASDRVWFLKGSDSGEGLKVRLMGIRWSRRKDEHAAQVLVVGAINMPGIGHDTDPPKATITLKLLARSDSLPVYGREQITFKKFGVWWHYMRRGWDWLATEDQFSLPFVQDGDTWFK